ncbi:MAG: glycosyltransferase family 2 protein [Phycisphaerales bacterium JB050]
MLTIVIPTRDRPSQLARTLREIELLGSGAFEVIGGAEVIIADNRSKFAVTAPRTLSGDVPVRVLHRRTNEAAAARNACAKEASSQGADDWLLMLDDDSAPMDARFVEELRGAPDDVAAVCAEIALENGARESGGLPEVPIGCGVAIRTKVFNELGGYDPSFHYYVEEYDLAAKMILAGWRIAFSPAFRVLHRKDSAGRNMDAILRSLVRNNAWVAQRYAPDGVLEWTLDETVERYRRIAERESAMAGYETGLAELRETLDAQRRTPMTEAQYDRFTGLAAVREKLGRLLEGHDGAVWVGMPEGAAPGKNAWAITRVLREMGATEVDDPRVASLWIPATLSPGPMLDAAERFEREMHRSETGATIEATRVETAWDARQTLASTGATAR